MTINLINSEDDYPELGKMVLVISKDDQKKHYLYTQAYLTYQLLHGEMQKIFLTLDRQGMVKEFLVGWMDLPEVPRILTSSKSKNKIIQ